MTRAALFALAVLVGSACSDDSTRISVDDQGFSIQAPEGWKVTRRGADTLLAPERGGQTIAVRAGARGPGRDRTDPASLVHATEQVLRSYPRAKLGPTFVVHGDDLEGTGWGLTFVPPAHKREYQRTHVLLVGEKHFWHLIHTAPVGEPLDRATFDALVASLREEA